MKKVKAAKARCDYRKLSSLHNSGEVYINFYCLKGGEWSALEELKVS